MIDAMDWNDPRNNAVITLHEVLVGARPVLLVIHEDGDGGWQFYDGFSVEGRSPAVAPKEEILLVDRTLREVLDLPVGWLARREAKDGPWKREKLQDNE